MGTTWLLSFIPHIQSINKSYSSIIMMWLEFCYSLPPSLLPLNQSYYLFQKTPNRFLCFDSYLLKATTVLLKLITLCSKLRVAVNIPKVPERFCMTCVLHDLSDLAYFLSFTPFASAILASFLVSPQILQTHFFLRNLY